MSERHENEYDVLVIGGGATGAGTARDCALRGLKTIMVERGDLANGATGRNHGLLHSGARYAVSDRYSASECIKENLILRKIASHCIEETDGFFVSLPEDDLSYQRKFVLSCIMAGIPARIMDPKQALRLEPSINPNIIGAVKVPDASVDPFRLTVSNMLDATAHGATVLTYHEVKSLIIESGRVVGAILYDIKNRCEKEIRARVTVNAAGVWGANIAALAGIQITVFPAKGTHLIFGHRVNNIVVNRCRKPSDADILVPGDAITIIGTTSDRVPLEEADHILPTPREVDLLLREGSKMVPSLKDTRIIRAYSGVRPLVADDSDPSGRNISRGIVCFDHETRDGVSGFISVMGGKLTTYRLMAEMATDMVCKKLKVSALCQTAELPLPGSEEAEKKEKRSAGKMTARAARGRHGTRSARIPSEGETLCACEQVSEGEVDYAINELGARSLSELRRRTRIGMGTCQGEYCTFRAAARLEKALRDGETSKRDMADFMNERWKGVRPVAWGAALREAQFTSWLYEGVYGLDKYDTNQ